MIMYCVLVLLFIPSNGFLLETKPSKTPGQTGDQYLTLDDKLRLQHELDNLRYDQEKTSVLASQLKQQLNEIRQQVDKCTSLNETRKEVGNIQAQYRILEFNYTTLTKKIEILKDKYYQQEGELSAMKNKTVELDKTQQALQQLKGIRQLQTMDSLQNQIHAVESSVTSLTSHEQARNQDFIALHNLIIQSRNQFYTFKANTSNSFEDLTKVLASHEQARNQNGIALQNLTAQAHDLFSTIKTDTSNSLQDLRKEVIDKFHYNNETLRDLSNIIAETRSQIIKNNMKVAMTACGSWVWTIYNSSDVLKFSSTKTEVGISSIVSFTSTGKFMCEVSGVYHLSAVILSDTSHSYFNIKKNGSPISRFNIATHTSTWNHITIAVVVADLQVGDTLSVEAETKIRVYGYDSCLTIFKL